MSAGIGNGNKISSAASAESGNYGNFGNVVFGFGGGASKLVVPALFVVIVACGVAVLVKASRGKVR